MQKTRQGRYISVQSNDGDESGVGMMFSTNTGRISLKDTEDDDNDSDDEPLIDT